MQDKIYNGLLSSYYGGMLTEYQQKVLHLYYDCDMSLAEIGEYLGITRQGVREVIIRSNKKLTEYEEKLGLVKKIKAISYKLDLIIKEEDVSDNIKEKLTEILSKIKEI